MASTYKTPGVYIVEKNAFPGSAVAVETAVPIFIGYTEKAERKGKSLIGEPTRITSFAEYVEMFGQDFKHQFGFTDKTKPIEKFTPDTLKEPVTRFYFYNAIRLFYQNGGSNCYIMSLGIYGKGDSKKEKIDIADFPDSVFEKLRKEFEPTMVVIPDFVSDRTICYELYKKVLSHCRDTQSRFGIFDVIPDDNDKSTAETISIFRTAIGSDALNYGAAYYPWLNTSIVQASEINFTNLAVTVDDLMILLPEADVTAIITKWKEVNKALVSSPEETEKELNKQNTILHESLLASSPTYKQIMDEIRNRLNLLPSSSAMAGIYTLVDNSRGVWKSPANVSISSVNSPAVVISEEEQKHMNVDVLTGRSVNVIRPFPGIGTLVWGARTLDGNSQDWRYINVRRTMIMIEQSLKLACSAYIFEPNDSGTWVTIKSMMNNFLVSLWMQGGLAGAVPEQAFDVQIGLGATMTTSDILDGVLRITVKLAIVRPAEFIVLTFQQKQQQS